MNAQANGLKMFASFNRGIFVPLVGANTEPQNVYNFLKDRNARISLDHVKGLMEGKEATFKDFEVVTVLRHGQAPAESIPAASSVASDTALAPTRRTPPVPTGPQPTNLRSGAAPVARGRGREYPPTGEVKPLKRGTVYAQLMEMLMKGATMKEMLAATGNETAGGVNDVLSWQIKQRGYGLRFEQETGKYFLVLPKGHTGLTYKD